MIVRKNIRKRTPREKGNKSKLTTITQKEQEGKKRTEGRRGGYKELRGGKNGRLSWD